VARAFKEVAGRKNTGPDDVHVQEELFKHAGENILDKMHRKCTAHWETGELADVSVLFQFQIKVIWDIAKTIGP